MADFIDVCLECRMDRHDVPPSPMTWADGLWLAARRDDSQAGH